MIIRISIFFVLFFLPFILDQVQGFITLTLIYNIKISLYIKLFMIAYFIAYLVGSASKKYTLIFFLLLIVLWVPVFNGFIIEPSSTIENFSFIVKLLFFPLVYFYFVEYFRINPNCIYKVLPYFRILHYMLFLAMLASIFGIGYSQYGINDDGLSIGYSGFFFAGNELGSLFFVISSISLYYSFICRDNVIINIIHALSILVIGFLIGTKVAILSSFLIVLILPLLLVYTKKGQKGIKVFKYYSLILTLGSMAILVFVIVFWDILVAYYDRWLFNYNRVSNVTSFIFNGRNDRLQNGFDIFVYQYNTFEQLFGSGIVFYQENMSEIFPRLAIEIDILDLLLAVGFIGTTVIYIFWLYIFSQNLMRSIKYGSFTSILCSFLIIVLISISFIAGHVIYSSLVGYYLAIILSLSKIVCEYNNSEQK